MIKLTIIIFMVLLLSSTHAVAQEQEAFAPVRTIDFEAWFENVPCPICPLAKTLTLTAVTFGEELFNGLRKSLLAFLGMGLGIFLLYKTARILLPFGGEGKDSFNEMMTMIIIVLLTGAALKSMDIYWQYIFMPIASGAVSMSNTIAASVATNIDKCDTTIIGQDNKQRAEQLAQKVECQIKQLSTTLSKGIVIGLSTMMGEINIKGFGGLAKAAVSGQLTMAIYSFLSGLIIVIAFCYTLFAVLLGMIEILYRWALISVLSPLMIAAFPLKQTRSFSFFGIKGLAESAVSMILIAVVAAIAVELINNVPIKFDDDRMMTIAAAFDIISNKESNEKQIILYFWNIGFWQLLIIAILSGLAMFKVHAFAAQLVGGGIASFSAQMGTSTLNLSRVSDAADLVYRTGADAIGLARGGQLSKGFSGDLNTLGENLGKMIRGRK